ncbi:type VII secretion protein EccC [Bifidobacterium stellenboschense]|nr:type VII secretion protein EccC [Bifidobacterium stellenboschense]
MSGDMQQQVSSRIDQPKAPHGKIVLQAPPELEASDGINTLLTMLVPLLGSLSAIVMMVMSNSGVTGFLTGGMFMLSSVGFVLVNGVRQRSQRKANLTSSRREYLAYLADLRTTVRTAAKKQRRAELWNAPAPDALVAIAQEGVRRWERIPTDEDFLDVRIGSAEEPLCLTLEAPELPPLAELDPVSASAAHRFMMAHRNLKDMPCTIDIRKYKRIEVLGDADQAQSLARTMLCQAAVWHGPEYLKIVVIASKSQRRAWSWVEDLPQAWSDEIEDGISGHGRAMLASSVEEANRLIGDDILHRSRFTGTGEATLPHLLVVRDGSVPVGDITHGEDGSIIRRDGFDGVTLIDLPEEWGDLEEDDVLRIIFSQSSIEMGLNVVRTSTVNQIEAITTAGRVATCEPDAISVQEAHAVASRLETVPQAEQDEEGKEKASHKKSSELADLLGIADIHHIDLKRLWAYKTGKDRLRVPIGLNADTSTTYLDIKESAQFGMGPHGVLVGATGSGKSEVLRTLVLSLALTHSPDQLNFVLIDFKGGATFAGMEGMPHISSIITNLGEEASLVDRMQDALTGEMTRRQELLRKAGNFANVSDYEKARLNGRSDLKPLPALFVVCDEFSELLAAKPDIVDSFVNIGRLGRSLEVHLLIASQRLEEGKLRGLDSHLSYRIGLRTFSASESRAVLGVPDAYTLPSIPGVGYLKPDPSTMIRFRASYVSGPPKGEPDTNPSNFDVAVDQMRRAGGTPAHQVWLPPLNVPNTLDEFFPDLAAVRGFGLVSASGRKAGYLSVPVALEDKPKEQKREVLRLDLSGAGGHVAIAGGPLTGKSTFMRTMVASLALTHSPLEVQCYALDLGGGTFAGMEDLAHMAGVALRGDDERINRMLAEVTSIINARERYFKANRIDSIGTYRQLRAKGKADDGYGEVFLFIDGWQNFKTEYEDLQAKVLDIVSRGLTFGVHVIISTSRWMDLRANIKDLMGTRLELRLGDPADSEIDRRIAVTVPKGMPGRGLASSKRHILVALPRIDGDHRADTMADGIKDLIAKVNAAWRGPKPPKLRLLPTRLERGGFLKGIPKRTLDARFILGVDEADLKPVLLNPRRSPHMFAFGDSRSGKSSFLRLVAQEIERYYDANGGKAKIFLVDYRRALLDEVSDKYLGQYLTNHNETSSAMTELAEFLATRIPGSDVTAEQLRSRSWWTGSDAYVLIDDYDLVATSRGNPIQPLQPLLAQASDIGLHVFLVRRMGGASRALYDPILQTFQDLGVTGLLFSGDPNEGALIGKTKPKPLVPGRVQVVSRDSGTFLAQLAYAASKIPESEDDSAD